MHLPGAITLLTTKPRFSAPWLREQLGVLKHPGRVLLLARRRAELVRGPGVVAANLTQGLRQIGRTYRYNPPAWSISPHVGVLRDTDALRWAVGLRQAGRIARLVAGPNLVVLPTDAPGLLDHPAVDLVVVPSEWVKDLYLHHCPSLAGRLAVWPSGVDTAMFVPGEPPARDRLLVYAKNPTDGLLRRVIDVLDARGMAHHVLTYGTFKGADYRRLLQTSWGMVYLSPSESQGLALHEAWSCDVPTLVWDRGFFEMAGARWDGASSAPFLTPRTGARFSGPGDFAEALDAFVAARSSFAPRAETLERFTLQRSAADYVSLFGAG